jgi:hypothetical protein
MSKLLYIIKVGMCRGIINDRKISIMVWCRRILYYGFWYTFSIRMVLLFRIGMIYLTERETIQSKPVAKHVKNEIQHHGCRRPIGVDCEHARHNLSVFVNSVWNPTDSMDICMIHVIWPFVVLVDLQMYRPCPQDKILFYQKHGTVHMDDLSDELSSHLVSLWLDMLKNIYNGSFTFLLNKHATMKTTLFVQTMV